MNSMEAGGFPVAPVLLAAVFIGFFVFIVIYSMKSKAKCRGEIREIDPDWFAKSQALYPEDDSVHRYFFTYDRNFSCQGHILVDREKQPVYEAHFMNNNVLGADEADFENHIIGCTHHHQIGHAGAGMGGLLSSSFSFDGENIWTYLADRGFSHAVRPQEHLAYTIDILQGAETIGTVYSSNGKNFFGAGEDIEAKPGTRGVYVLSCRNRDLDILFLYTMAFARTDGHLRSML